MDKAMGSGECFRRVESEVQAGSLTCLRDPGHAQAIRANGPLDSSRRGEGRREVEGGKGADHLD